MKILRAHFRNFRLLRDVEIDFSTNPNKPLTVIRAENESGKTTLLLGLQWGLYGEAALPGRSGDFRLHPINWEVPGESAFTSVEVDLEVNKPRKTRRGTIIRQPEVYRVTRTVRETPDGGLWTRDSSSISLHHRTDKGWEQERFPERILAEMVSGELREVFFTDGDRALNFIEAPDPSAKRDLVEKSVRSLLGLDIIDSALTHVKTTLRRFSSEAGKVSDSDRIDGVTVELERVESEIDDHDKIISESSVSVSNIETEMEEVSKNISSALLKGDRRDLESRRARNESAYREALEAKKSSENEHSLLFRSMVFSRDLMGEPLNGAVDNLNELRAQKRFPKTSIPVLEDVLSVQQCVCGESLDSLGADSRRRREHVERMIEDTRQADDVQNELTDAYHGVRYELLREENVSWVNRSDDISDRRDDVDTRISDLGRESRELDALIAQLGDVDIAQLQNNHKKLASMRDRARDNKARSEAAKSHLESSRESLKRERDRLLREQDKGAKVRANLRAAEDVKEILERAKSRITLDELSKVSALMNTYFLEMIGADPEESSIIRRAEISENFDILVYGTGDRELRPDRDINGGSRRALTLAFVMALTKVSEVVAPNVIDTPLGMMSGYVKRAVLRSAALESSQLVLLLTRSEIAGCEDIIDEVAGKAFTLTNTGHYPRMLEYEPNSEIAQVVRCECDHRSACQICQRRDLISAGSNEIMGGRE